MTPELQRQIRRHHLWFGSYKKSGELVKIHVWLTVRNGCIEFLTAGESYKARRIRRNSRVICFIGRDNGPPIPGIAEILTDGDVIDRIYRAYWKTHPVLMIVLGSSIKKKIESGKQVAVRVRPDDPNPLAGVDDPVL